MISNVTQVHSVRPARTIWLSALTLLVITAVWYGVTAFGTVKPIFLPSPQATAQALWDFVISGVFIQALGASFLRIATATLLAVVAGSAIGVAMGISRIVDSMLSPVTEPLRYVPITALIPLLVLWFGIGEGMKIAFLFVGIVFYFIPLVRNAIRSVPQEYVDVARAFGVTTRTIIARVYWPQALPRIFDGLIIVNGIGWTYVILAEILNARNGLGYMIHIAGRLQRSDEVFAGLILISTVAILSDRILRAIREKYLFW